MDRRSKSTLARQGLETLRREGLRATANAGLRVMNLNYEGYYYYYLRHLYRTRVRRCAQPTDPFTVVSVSTEAVRRIPDPRFARWEFLGEARSGKWDRSDRTVEDSIKYRSVVDRFENGTPWEETDIYREAVKRIERGETYWNGCRTLADVERRTEYVDDLFERIREEGYRSQEEIYGNPLRSIVLSRTFDRSKEEIAVAIGRDGEVLFVDGNHRLAIANVLSLEEIPVHVVTRHSGWQEIREEIRDAHGLADLGERARTHLEHPDVRPLISGGLAEASRGE